MGIHTQLSGSSRAPGRRTANSTRSSEPSRVLTLRSYCEEVSTSSSSAPSCTSPQVPRALTLVSTLLRSRTPPASSCISPRPFCTASRRSLTSLKDSPRRFSSVPCSFSSTVCRISSSFFELLSCISRTRWSSVPRSWSSPSRLLRLSWLTWSVTLFNCSPCWLPSVPTLLVSESPTRVSCWFTSSRR